MIEYAILALLSWKPFSGYDLKKLIAESEVYYWSGNNNQIYNSLVGLHKAGLVDQEVQPQESLPARKVYTITAAGQAALHAWVRSSPALPEFRSTFLVQLAWADQLAPQELDALLGQYEQELALQVRMQAARAGRESPEAPGRSSRERYLWQQVQQHQQSVFQHEWDWVRGLRAGLNQRFSKREGE
jgi:PadR family transcriptional regulator, regulatory protein AphA